MNLTDIYYYKDKPYKILVESKIKFSGIRDFLASIGCQQQTFEDLDDANVPEWIDVVIYECLYECPDGKIWVRIKEQFYELFKTK